MTPAFDSLQAALYMSGHGYYVWLAWGISVPVLLLLAVLPLWHRHQLLSARRRRPRVASEWQGD